MDTRREEQHMHQDTHPDTHPVNRHGLAAERETGAPADHDD